MKRTSYLQFLRLFVLLYPCSTGLCGCSPQKHAEKQLPMPKTSTIRALTAQGTDPDLRKAAIEEIRSWPRATALPLLRKALLSEKEPGVVREIARALSELGDDQLLKEYAAGVNFDVSARRRIVLTASGRGDGRTIALLRKAAGDENMFVRLDAYDVIFGTRSDEALRIILSLPRDRVKSSDEYLAHLKNASREIQRKRSGSGGG